LKGKRIVSSHSSLLPPFASPGSRILKTYSLQKANGGNEDLTVLNIAAFFFGILAEKFKSAI
jgi:hypothetical protein